MADIWILYSSAFDIEEDNPAKRMLREALSKHLDAELLYYQYFEILDTNLYYIKNKVTKFPKIAFVRCHELWLVNYLEAQGIKVINSSFTIKSCRDKWITHSLVSKVGVPQIKTEQLLDKSYKDVTNLFGTTFILKYRFGSQGKSIYLINNEEEFDNIVKDIDRMDYVVQEYISTSYGKDVRVYIVGDKVVGAVLRKNEEGFMSNLAQGGLSYDYPMTDELITNSMKIKDILKGDIISVDYVFGEVGLLFCEANTNAGFASFNYLGYPMREIFVEELKKALQG